MTDTTVSVFTLDSESQTYKPTAHNLSAAQAVERLSSDLSSRIVNQTGSHRTADPLKCKACKKAAEELTAKHTGSAGVEAGEQPVAAQESESD
jgi:hypothetical protein